MFAAKNDRKNSSPSVKTGSRKSVSMALVDKVVMQRSLRLQFLKVFLKWLLK